VAFRYRINLIKDQVGRRRAERALLQLLTVSLLVFAVALLVTFWVYLARDSEISAYNQQADTLNRQIGQRGIAPAQVEQLRRENAQVAATLGAFTNLFQNSASWSCVLVSLEKCCQSGEVRLRKVSALGLTQSPKPAIRVSAECSVENPVSCIQAFLGIVARQEGFGRPTLVSVDRRGEEGPVIFEADVPLEEAISVAPARPGGASAAP
jgi:hypothetical protein